MDARKALLIYKVSKEGSVQSFKNFFEVKYLLHQEVCHFLSHVTQVECQDNQIERPKAQLTKSIKFEGKMLTYVVN